MFVFWQDLVCITGGAFDNRIPYNNDDGIVDRTVAVKNNILSLSGDFVKIITT